MRFSDEGRIPLDTGHLERSIRPVAVGRKNYLFFGSLGVGRQQLLCTPSSKARGSIIWT